MRKVAWGREMRRLSAVAVVAVCIAGCDANGSSNTDFPASTLAGTVSASGIGSDPCWSLVEVMDAAVFSMADALEETEGVDVLDELESAGTAIEKASGALDELLGYEESGCNRLLCDRALTEARIIGLIWGEIVLAESASGVGEQDKRGLVAEHVRTYWDHSERCLQGEKLSSEQ